MLYSEDGLSTNIFEISAFRFLSLAKRNYSLQESLALFTSFFFPKFVQKAFIGWWEEAFSIDLAKVKNAYVFYSTNKKCRKGSIKKKKRLKS